MNKVVFGLIMALGSPDFYVRETAEWILNRIPAAYLYPLMKFGCVSPDCEVRTRSNRIAGRCWNELNVVRPGYKFIWQGEEWEVSDRLGLASTYRENILIQTGMNYAVRNRSGSRITSLYEHQILYIARTGYLPSEEDGV